MGCTAGDSVELVASTVVSDVLVSTGASVELGGSTATGWSSEAATLGIPGLAMPGLGTPALGIPGLGTPALGKPGLGIPTLGTPALGTPALGMPGFGIPLFGMPGLGTPLTTSPCTALVFRTLT